MLPLLRLRSFYQGPRLPCLNCEAESEKGKENQTPADKDRDRRNIERLLPASVTREHQGCQRGSTTVVLIRDSCTDADDAGSHYLMHSDMYQFFVGFFLAIGDPSSP